MRTIKPRKVINYYEVLDVSPDSSAEQIRSAFKRQVMATHPDKNPERREWSERRMREVVEAYEAIGDPTRRAEFDHAFRAYRRAVRPPPVKRSRPFFFYKTDPEARALLILHHLTHCEPEKAVEILWEMELRWGRRFLAESLDRKDYLDCLFLLGEHHLERKQFREAALRFREFYFAERGRRHRRHYFDQAARYLKDLYLRKLPRFVEPEDVLEYLAEIDELEFSPAEDRLRFVRRAEAYLRSGRADFARSVLEAARASYPNAKENASIEAMIARGA